MTALLVATKNRGKLAELRELLRGLSFHLVSLDDIPETETVAETGASFVENSVLKAVGYSKQAGLLTLADDSGLEVAGLNGAPGVLSARYAGEQASDAARVEKLLHELHGGEVSTRSARFVSAIAIADQEGRILNISEGVCEGELAFQPRGTNGFGYDPIFVPEGFDRTFAELPTEVKNEISHRAKALQAARNYLASLTVDCPAG